MKYTEQSEAPPKKISRWGWIWKDIVNNYPIVPGTSLNGWGSTECSSDRELKLLQCALHQRSLRNNSNWRIQTAVDKSNLRIYFRKVEEQESMSKSRRKSGDSDG